ncbi:hypothetical protein V8E53_006916 [Lactarius tabidus]
MMCYMLLNDVRPGFSMRHSHHSSCALVDGESSLVRRFHTDPSESLAQQVDELVDEWSLESLSSLLAPRERTDITSEQWQVKTGKQVFILAGCNFTGLFGNETTKVSPPRCRDPSKGFLTIPCVIFTFEQRVADWDIDFPIQKSFQISRSNARWLNNSDGKSLAVVHLSAEKEHRKRRGPLTRRFTVTENTYERDSARFMYLESCTRIETVMEMESLVDSPTDGLKSAGEFYMDSRRTVDKQWINWTLFIFSTADSALFGHLHCVGHEHSAEDDIDPEQVPDRAKTLTIPYATSPINRLSLRSATLPGSASAKSSHPTTITKPISSEVP